MSELYLAHKLLYEEKLAGLPHLQAELIREWESVLKKVAELEAEITKLKK